MDDAESTTWWALIPSELLLEYLRAAHEGEDPSMVLARAYLAAQHEDYSES